MNLKELREKRSAIKASIKAIIAKADAEAEGVLSAEQNAEIRKLEEQFASVDETIKVRERAEDRDEADATTIGRRTAEPNAAITPTAITDVKPKFEEDPKKGFKSHKDYFLAVMNHFVRFAHLPSREAKDERLRFLATAGSDEHSTFSDPYGGFLVPEAMGPSGVMTTDSDADPFAGRTTTIPMQTPSFKMAYRVDKDHSTSVSGGLQWYRREEAGAATTSRMQTKKFQFTAHNLMGATYETEELIQDSPTSVIALIEAGFRSELGSTLLQERLYGTGVGEWLGIANNPALITISKETGQAASTIVFENITKMYARLWGKNSGVWIANHDTIPTLTKLNLSVGTGGTPLFVFSAAEGIPSRLLGLPIFFNEYPKSVGTAGDIILVNPTQYLEGTYQPLQSAESIHVRFLNHERTFKFWTRNAGSPWWDSALTPKNGATLSPFVNLATRS